MEQLTFGEERAVPAAAPVTEATGYEIERSLAAAGALRGGRGRGRPRRVGGPGGRHLRKHRPDIEGQLSLL